MFADLLEFETKVTKTSENISAVINAAFKIDDRTESNFISTVLDLQERLTLVNKRGLDRQLAELQFSKARELAALKANNQLTEEEYRRLASIVIGIYDKMSQEIIKKQSFAQKIKEGLQQIAVDLPNILLQAFEGDLRGEALGKALGASIGAGIGAAIGAYFGGPFGATLGASAGAAIGQGIAEMFTTDAERIARRSGEHLGIVITEEMGQAIVDTANNYFHGNMDAAQLFHLGDIIRAGGGLNADNIETLFARLHDVFSMVETGAFTSAQAMQALDESFKTFADFVTKDGSLASAQLLEIIRLNDEMGIHSDAIKEFVTRRHECDRWPQDIP